MTPEVDYSRTKTAALEMLASRGNTAAAAELARRGTPSTASTVPDLTQLTVADLWRLVNAWHVGMFPEDRADSRRLAERAYTEIEIRHRVDLQMHDGQGPRPAPPRMAPWRVPHPPRCVSWKRPAGSTLYPSEADYAAAAMEALAREAWAHRRRMTHVE